MEGILLIKFIVFALLSLRGFFCFPKGKLKTIYIYFVCGLGGLSGIILGGNDSCEGSIGCAFGEFIGYLILSVLIIFLLPASVAAITVATKEIFGCENKGWDYERVARTLPLAAFLFLILPPY